MFDQYVKEKITRSLAQLFVCCSTKLRSLVSYFNFRKNFVSVSFKCCFVILFNALSVISTPILKRQTAVQKAPRLSRCSMNILLSL